MQSVFGPPTPYLQLVSAPLITPMQGLYDVTVQKTKQKQKQ